MNMEAGVKERKKKEDVAGSVHVAISLFQKQKGKNNNNTKW